MWVSVFHGKVGKWDVACALVSLAACVVVGWIDPEPGYQALAFMFDQFLVVAIPGFLMLTTLFFHFSKRASSSARYHELLGLRRVLYFCALVLTPSLLVLLAFNIYYSRHFSESIYDMVMRTGGSMANCISTLLICLALSFLGYASGPIAIRYTAALTAAAGLSYLNMQYLGAGPLSRVLIGHESDLRVEYFAAWNLAAMLVAGVVVTALYARQRAYEQDSPQNMQEAAPC